MAGKQEADRRAVVEAASDVPEQSDDALVSRRRGPGRPRHTGMQVHVQMQIEIGMEIEVEIERLIDGKDQMRSFVRQKTTGGKILVFAGTMPDTGAGALKNRYDSRLMGTDKVLDLLLAVAVSVVVAVAVTVAVTVSVLVTAAVAVVAAEAVSHVRAGEDDQYAGGQLLYGPRHQMQRRQSLRGPFHLLRHVRAPSPFPAPVLVPIITCTRTDSCQSHGAEFASHAS